MADLIPTGYTSAHLSCDEGQAFWQADFTLASLDSFARTQVGDPIELEVYGEIYSLIVDSRTLQRQLGQVDYTISAISPVGFMDAPWAAEMTVHYAEPVDAHAAVEAILGLPVSWDLPDWIIPAGALSMTGVTPLQAAKAIVEAVGGVIESYPSGDVHCRMRDPISIPDYDTATVDQYFTDADWVAVSAVDAPSKGFNRVTISNNTTVASGITDRLEVIDDPVDTRRKTIRAYLSYDRPVYLVHTGAPETVIVPLGVVERVESEVAEFVSGKATLKYPGQILSSLVWQHNDLGTVSVSGSVATATVVDGYSLAAVSYTVVTVDWLVTLAQRAEAVQFLLVEA